jgi:hypothetical protein
MNWEAFAYWLRSRLEADTDLPDTVIRELQQHYPAFLECDKDDEVHNKVHTCARIARSDPNERHRIRLRMRDSEQGKRWCHGFLIPCYAANLMRIQSLQSC